MIMITLYARQQKRHRCIEQSFELCGRGRGGMICTPTSWPQGTTMWPQRLEFVFEKISGGEIKVVSPLKLFLG